MENSAHRKMVKGIIVERTKSKRYCTVVSWIGQRRWRALLCVLAVLCLSIPAPAFAKSLNGTLLGQGTGREVAFNHHGKPLNDWAGTLKFKLDSGEDLLVFCIQIDVRVRSGDRYRSDGPVLGLPNGCQIRYLLDAYPASTAKDADEAAARQMAIWVFSDGVDPTTIDDAKVRDRAIALVKEANGKPCPKPRTEAPDLTLDPSTANAAVGQVVAYTVHASSGDAGHPLNISVSGAAVFSDANGANLGQQQQTINLDGQSGATIWVLSTGAGETTVSVALPYRLEAGTVYSQLDDTSPTQRLVLAENLNLVAKASAQLSVAVEVPPALTEQATVPATTPTAPAEQATVPATTPAPPAATSAPATHRPKGKDQTPTPAEQPTVTVLVGEAESVTPVLAAEATALPAPAANEQAGAAAVAAPAPQAGAAVRPRSLPRTGEPAGPAIGLILLGAAALLVGALLRGRRTMR
jgi:hypothetical protein